MYSIIGYLILQISKIYTRAVRDESALKFDFGKLEITLNMELLSLIAFPIAYF